MHPYHTYVVLFDRDLDNMVMRALQRELDNAKRHLNSLNNSKSKLDSFAATERRVAESLVNQCEADLEMWYNKKVKKIKQDEIETLFNEV